MPTSVPANPLDSPCTGVCALDEQDICLGCQRHISEIAAWSRLGADERRRILALLPARAHPKENDS